MGSLTFTLFKNGIKLESTTLLDWGESCKVTEKLFDKSGKVRVTNTYNRNEWFGDAQKGLYLGYTEKLLSENSLKLNVQAGIVK